MPKPQPIPRVPQIDSDIVQQRADKTAALVSKSGSAGNIMTDLSPSDVAGQRPVLKPANAVYLGQ